MKKFLGKGTYVIVILLMSSCLKMLARMHPIRQINVYTISYHVHVYKVDVTGIYGYHVRVTENQVRIISILLLPCHIRVKFCIQVYTRKHLVAGLHQDPLGEHCNLPSGSWRSQMGELTALYQIP